MGVDVKKPAVPADGSSGGSRRDAPREAQASGRVGFDTRGDAVWQWRQEDGQFRPEASTTRVQKLQSAELSLEPTLKVTALETATPAKADLPCGGFNPYDRGTLAAPKENRPPKPRVKFPPIVAPPVDNSLPARARRWLKSRIS
jgi:hypothetical protein